MNVTKLGLVSAIALVAGSAFGQFGAASKADFGPNGLGTYATFSPFAQTSGGGNTVSGYLLSFEKRNSAEDNALIIGGWFGSFDSRSGFQFHVKKPLKDFDLQLGLLGGDITGNDLDFSILAFKELPTTGGASGISASVFGGFYRSAAANSTDFSAGIKANHALQNGWSVDATFWYIAGSPSRTFLSAGLGYRF